MSYSYSVPLSYGNQEPLNYMDYQAPDNQGYTTRKKSSAPAVAGGLVVGGITGGVIGVTRKNPYMRNGVPTDVFAKRAYNKYIKKAAEDEKKSYGQYNEVIKKINKVKTTDELRTLLNNNPEASKEITTSLNRTTDEFLNNVTNQNLASNKETIKNKLEMANKTRYQNMKNNISSCWDSTKSKFVKPDDMDENMFKAIKKTSRNVKASIVGKYTAIAAAIGGVAAFITHKLVQHKKAVSQQQY